MRSVILRAVALALCLFGGAATADVKCGRAHTRPEKVIGGHIAADGNWPWVVAIGQAPGCMDPQTGVPCACCTGALISDRYVLTACHCTFDQFDRPVDPYQLWVAAGSADFLKSEHNATVKQLWRHPKYESEDEAERRSNDLAILEIPQVTLGKSLEPLCIADAFEEVPDDMAYVAGYGLHNDHVNDTYEQLHCDPFMRENVVELHKYEACKFNESKIPKNSYICAGGNDRGVHEGDSGGPLMVNRNGVFYEVGVVRGPKDNYTTDYDPEAQYFDPPQFTRIARADHCDWIKEVTKGEVTCIPIV
ncbi:hypothetical protein AAVH_15979 [Aphelenchoides avenae]|nr:hypothetical protein AAVH_15979 [Aphelenchus avenae]